MPAHRQAARPRAGVSTTSVTFDLRHAAPPALQPLLTSLATLSPRNPLAVLDLLKSLRPSRDALGAAVREAAEGYVRSIVYRDASIEVLVLTWRAGQASPAHDHAGSTCVVQVIEGVAHEQTYARRHFGGLAKLESRVLTAGEISTQVGDEIHTLGNAPDSDALLVTLHIYSPPLTAMTQFDV